MTHDLFASIALGAGYFLRLRLHLVAAPRPISHSVASNSGLAERAEISGLPRLALRMMTRLIRVIHRVMRGIVRVIRGYLSLSKVGGLASSSGSLSDPVPFFGVTMALIPPGHH